MMLAPAIVEAICGDSRPPDLTAQELRCRSALPTTWDNQQRELSEIAAKPDSVAERGEFELPVPICEQSDDSNQVDLCDIETNSSLEHPGDFFVRRSSHSQVDGGQAIVREV
jgi:hypothetical protein